MTATVLSNEDSFYTLPAFRSEEQQQNSRVFSFGSFFMQSFIGTEGTRLDIRFLREQRLLKALGRLAALQDLPVGWDSYGAPAPAKTSSINAFAAVKLLSERDVYPSHISPTDDGGIIFEYSYSGSNYYWEFESDGDIGLLKKSGHQEEAVDFSREEIPDVVARMHNG